MYNGVMAPAGGTRSATPTSSTFSEGRSSQISVVHRLFCPARRESCPLWGEPSWVRRRHQGPMAFGIGTQQGHHPGAPCCTVFGHPLLGSSWGTRQFEPTAGNPWDARWPRRSVMTAPAGRSKSRDMMQRNARMKAVSLPHEDSPARRRPPLPSRVRRELRLLTNWGIFPLRV